MNKGSEGGWVDRWIGGLESSVAQVLSDSHGHKGGRGSMLRYQRCSKGCLLKVAILP